MRARAGEVVIVLAAAILITLVMTWPLAIRAGSAGRVDSGDGQFSIWNVAWVARTLVVDPRGLYDANIFYPHRGALAYSEANLGAGFLAVPFYWASGGNPYLAHNAVVLLAFVLALTGTYSLVRHLTGHRGAAAVAAVAFAFCPYVVSHIPHIQLLMTAGLPYSLLALHRYVERQTAGRVCVLALALVAQALSCGYYGIFAGLLVGLGILFYAVSRGLWRRGAYWAGAIAAAALAAAIVLPFFWPYVALQQSSGFARTLADSRRWSAMWRSYAASAAWAHRWLLPYLGSWGEVLYPGTVATLLGLMGLVGRRRGGGGRPGRDHVAFYGTIVVMAFWSSLGPDAGLYAWLHNAVPVFSWLRAPSRLGLVVVLALAVLSGFALAELLERTRRIAFVSTLLVLITMADLLVAPLVLFEAKPVASAYTSLRKWPNGPVVEFPFFYLRTDFPRHSEYMLNSTSHWRPLINGYSDFIPPDFRAMVIPLSSFPNPESFAILKQLRAQYVIFHLNLYDRRAVVEVKARIEQYRDYLRPIRQEDPVWLFQIVAWPPEH
jgi:hypothetical protein